ncbi:protein SSUH2 homolog [Glandiceps talaboti]
MGERQPLVHEGGPPPAYGQAPYPPTQGYPPQQPAPGYPQGGGYPPQQPTAGYPQGGGYPPQQPGYSAPDGGNIQGTDTASWQGDIPTEDPEDNPNAQAPQPTAPPMEKMDRVEGYENMDAPLAPPPSYREAMQAPPPDQQQTQPHLPTINEEQAKEALVQHVSEHCCYGSKPAKDLIFTNMMPSSAFHYILDTFTEKRTTSWAYEPFHGQPIDGPYNGRAPGPWEVEARPPTMFKTQKIQVEVPHTASVKPCHDCVGLGRRRCYHCFGRGRTRCAHCNGIGHQTHFHHGGHHDHHHGGHGHHNHHHHHHHGHMDHQICPVCHGSGRKRCFVCHGHGHITCHTCHGKGQLKCYIKLTIQWLIHHDDHIVERTALPDHLIREVQGETVFNQEQPRLWPVAHFPDQNINDASNNLIQRHHTSFRMERILMQRHSVRVIPVTHVHCFWKKDSFSYFVYGFEHKVHAPEYPQQCCCGCTII